MRDNAIDLTQTQILRLWLPLAAMWMFMAVEQPFMTAVIARLEQAEVELAAFGVMFAIALAVESPVLQLLAAATALGTDRRRYRRLLRFTHILALGLTALHLLLAATPLYALILEHLIGAPREVIAPSRIAFLLASPFTAAVAYRRLWQGVLIRHGRTGVIPITMLARFGAMGTVLLIGYRTRVLPGAALAGLALTVGVVVGAAATWVFVRGVIDRRMPDRSEHGDEGVAASWKGLLRFYVPLSLTSVLYLLAQPLLTVGIARAPYPLESLAVWPVIKAYLFLFSALALSFQEVAVALLPQPNGYHALRRFTAVLGLALSGLFVLLAATPANTFWYTRVAGLSPRLAPFAGLPTVLLAAVPLLITVKSWFRAQHIHRRETGAIAKAVLLYSAALFAAVLAGARILPVPGAVTAALALTFAVAVEIAYLLCTARRPGVSRQAEPTEELLAERLEPTGK